MPTSSNVCLSREPWNRSLRIVSATPVSVQATSPPSPSAKRFFVGKKLKVEQTPVVAIPGAPKAWAASSSSGSPSAASSASGAGPAEEVHRHDRLRLLRDPLRDVVGVEIERDGIDVGEDGRRPDPRDRLRGRVEREGGADHLVAAPDPQRLEREHERVRAVRDPDRVWHAEVRGGLALERLHLRAEDEAAGLEHLGEALLELGDVGRVLRLDVDEGDHDRTSVPASQVASGPPGRLRRARRRAAGGA